MKKPNKIVVVGSYPAPGQCGIREIIGVEFPVVGYDQEDGTVSVKSEAHAGLIVLQPAEYEVIS